MNKAEFVKRVARTADLSAEEAQRALNAVLREIEDALRAGEEVALPGFGRFSVAERAARTGADPRDPGRRIEIPARRVPRFTPGSILKRAVERDGSSGGSGTTR
ncbi:MAG: HU family DNA-binding protein [Thermoleophilia bacterium]|nr:HU family DNA-binding protein [Thermoleophilia bacterium]